MLNNKRSMLNVTVAAALTVSMMTASATYAQNAPGSSPAPAPGNAPGSAAGRAGDRPASALANDMAASSLLDNGIEVLASGETERGIKMIETVYEQYPASNVRYRAYLTLGKHYLATKDQAKAIGYLRNARTIEAQDRTVPDNLRDVYLESLYLMGVANYEQRQYAAAFPLLRRITDDFPTTTWANQSYFYIGMCHFNQENWAKAIEALSMVGTFVSTDSPAAQVVESGRRFYVKVADADLPVLTKLGQNVTVIVQSKSGDKETVSCVPMPGSPDAFIGSIATEMGNPKPGDGTLQIIGGDSIACAYSDGNTQEGKKNILRNSSAKVVSTGAVNLTLGDYETPTITAFSGQPLFVVLQDNDLDATPTADTVKVRVVSRYKPTIDEVPTAKAAAGKPSDKPASSSSSDKSGEPADPYVTRDEVTLTLTEQPNPGAASTGASGGAAASGGGGIHTGRFTGKTDVTIVRDDKTPERTDGLLQCALGDEIVVTYIDEVHAQGNAPRTVLAKAAVIGEIENRPRATQYIVDDPVVSARKNLVEASAYLELAHVFRSLGLNKNAATKADEGLARVEPIVRSPVRLPPSLVEQAFKSKWELQLAKDDMAAAIATCEAFNRLFPESPFVDQALMGIAKGRFEERKFADAQSVYRRVLNLPHSLSKAEAAFRSAECAEELMKAAPKSREKVPGSMDSIISQYKVVADKYRDSEFAGPALAKMVDFYFDAEDYSQADELLTQIFQDYPDAGFLDAMLLKWIKVAFQMKDARKAYDKCQQLIFDYPESPHAKKAREYLPRLEALLKRK
jgi:TolA-binding protein